MPEEQYCPAHEGLIGEVREIKQAVGKLGEAVAEGNRQIAIVATNVSWLTRVNGGAPSVSKNSENGEGFSVSAKFGATNALRLLKIGGLVALGLATGAGGTEIWRWILTIGS